MSALADDTRAITNLAIGAAIGYAIWYFFFSANAPLKAASTAENNAVTSLANWYANLTGSGATVPTGTILLPNGSTVPVSSVNVNAIQAPQNASGIAGAFSYNGQNYYLNTGADSNGNYAASTAIGQ